MPLLGMDIGSTISTGWGLVLGFKPRGELCCSPALMAGMFGDSNQNNGLNLPCRSSGTGTIYVVG